MHDHKASRVGKEVEKRREERERERTCKLYVREVRQTEEDGEQTSRMTWKEQQVIVSHVRRVYSMPI